MNDYTTTKSQFVFGCSCCCCYYCSTHTHYLLLLLLFLISNSTSLAIVVVVVRKKKSCVLISITHTHTHPPLPHICKQLGGVLRIRLSFASTILLCNQETHTHTHTPSQWGREHTRTSRCPLSGYISMSTKVKSSSLFSGVGCCTTDSHTFRAALLAGHLQRRFSHNSTSDIRRIKLQKTVYLYWHNHKKKNIHRQH